LIGVVFGKKVVLWSGKDVDNVGYYQVQKRVRNCYVFPEATIGQSGS
jgi:hypothetical protein